MTAGGRRHPIGSPEGLAETPGYRSENVSGAVEHVAPDRRMEDVHAPDIRGCEPRLVKRPGYGPLSWWPED